MRAPPGVDAPHERATVGRPSREAKPWMTGVGPTDPVALPTAGAVDNPAPRGDDVRNGSLTLAELFLFRLLLL